MTVTVAQVRDALAWAATAHPATGDARVRRRLEPRYVEHGQPCCLVAVVLHRCGFTVAQLRQLDHERGRPGGGVVFGHSRHPLMSRVQPVARELLDYVQQHQDHGREDWDAIVDRALQRGRYALAAVDRAYPPHDLAVRGRVTAPFAWNTGLPEPPAP